MVDNTENRTHNVFFYGLYMDPEILKNMGVQPNNPRIASVPDYALRIGNKATLLRTPGKSAHGIIYSLTHRDIHQLYWGAGLHEYAAEALMAHADNQKIPVLCCNLIEPPMDNESNPEYQSKLEATMVRLGLPWTLE